MPNGNLPLGVLKPDPARKLCPMRGTTCPWRARQGSGLPRKPRLPLPGSVQRQNAPAPRPRSVPWQTAHPPPSRTGRRWSAAPPPQNIASLGLGDSLNEAAVRGQTVQRLKLYRGGIQEPRPKPRPGTTARKLFRSKPGAVR